MLFRSPDVPDHPIESFSPFALCLDGRFCFSDHRSTDYPIFASLCLLSPLHSPPGGKRFVANKRSSAIRPNGHRTVESLSPRFSAVQSGPISILFFRSNCPVGRGSQLMKVARHNIRRASTVIVSREPNDLDQGSKLCPFLSADC